MTFLVSDTDDNSRIDSHRKLVLALKCFYFQNEDILGSLALELSLQK